MNKHLLVAIIVLVVVLYFVLVTTSYSPDDYVKGWAE